MEEENIILEPRGTVTNSEVDTYNSFMPGGVKSWLPSTFYYYFLDSSLQTQMAQGALVNNGAIMATCPAIESVIHMPFLSKDDLNLMKIPYDTETFGRANGVILNWQGIATGDKPSVYRVRSTNAAGTEYYSWKIKKTLNPVKTYPDKPGSVGVGKPRNWKNESKLYQYPYRKIEIHDFFNEPLVLLPHLCNSTNQQISLFNIISNNGKHSLEATGYAKDIYGFNSSMISVSNMDMPISSDQYNRYFAENKNQMSAQARGAAIDVVGAATIGALSTVATGGLALPAAVGLTGNAIKSILNREALKTDLKEAPRVTKTQGGDPYYGFQTGQNRVVSLDMGLQEQDARVLGDFFAMYGYAQNRIMKPNIRNRHYYNYIKTSGVNLKAKTGIPKEHFIKLKAIFDQGVTIFHMDRAGVEVGNYQYDNVEV